MKLTQIFLLSAALTFAMTAWAQTAKPAAPTSPTPAPTLASMVDDEITAIEKQIIDIAEAMPEDKYNFSPESLNIPGDDYKGVRTFALQVKHVAAALWPWAKESFRNLIMSALVFNSVGPLPSFKLSGSLSPVRVDQMK